MLILISRTSFRINYQKSTSTVNSYYKTDLELWYSTVGL